MRSLLLASFFVFAVASAVGAEPRHPEEGMMCLTPGGSQEPGVCRRGDSWGDADVCTCRGAAIRVDVPVCGRAEHPPAESVRLDKFRSEWLKTHNSLYGASFEGRRLCVVVHHPRQY